MEPNTHEAPKRENKVLALLQANAIPVAIVIAGLLIGSAVVLNGRVNAGKAAAAAAAQPAGANAPAKAANIDEIRTAGNPFIGKADAPVTIAYWYDYQCPFCKKVETEVFPQLISDYVDTGKVKIVFKGYPVLGSDSQSAALAERGIWALYPDKFYKWHEEMYTKQDAENSGWGNRKDIIDLAKSLGMDGDKLDAYVVKNAADYQKTLEADMAEGQTYGVTGTPSFMLGKKLIVGSVPYDQIKSAIDEVLKGK